MESLRVKIPKKRLIFLRELVEIRRENISRLTKLETPRRGLCQKLFDSWKETETRVIYAFLPLWIWNDRPSLHRPLVFAFLRRVSSPLSWLPSSNRTPEGKTCVFLARQMSNRRLAFRAQLTSFGTHGPIDTSPDFHGKKKMKKTPDKSGMILLLARSSE